MSIVDQYGNPVSCASRNFANGADRSDRSRPPEPLFKDDIEKLIPNRDREWLVSGSRKMFQNFPPLEGALTQRADNVIGRAWSPKFTGQDKEWGKQAASWLVDQWYGSCDVRGRSWDFKTLLWNDCVATDRDGDFFIYLTEGASGYPLTQRIPANRVGQRWFGDKVPDGPYKGRKISHGVVLDKVNRAIAYHVLGDTQAEDRFIDARDIIHVFDPKWHDQTRGIPAASGALKYIYGSMTATEREQMNQLIRSSYGLIEYNEHGGPDPEDPSNTKPVKDGDGNQSPFVESLAGGMIKYFRSNSGGKLEALDNNMPGDAWDRFQDRVLRMLANALNWPYPLFWKEDSVNAALVRNIQEKARKSVEDRQDVIKSPAIFTIRYAIAKAIKIGILKSPKNADDWWRWDFQMPAKFSIDQGREAQQMREDFRAGLVNRTRIIAERGGDVEQDEDERIEEVVRRKRKIKEALDANPDLEIDEREFFMLTPNDQPQPDAQESTEPETKDKKQEEEE